MTNTGGFDPSFCHSNNILVIRYDMFLFWFHHVIYFVSLAIIIPIYIIIFLFHYTQHILSEPSEVVTINGQKVPLRMSVGKRRTYLFVQIQCFVIYCILSLFLSHTHTHIIYFQITYHSQLIQTMNKLVNLSKYLILLIL